MRYSATQYASALHDFLADTAPAKRRETIRGFLAAVAKNGSLGLLPEIMREFTAQRDRQKKIRDVTVRAAERLSERSVARRLRFRARVKSERDARLGGGAVVEVNDLRVDNSVARRLERVREAFTK